MRDQPDTKTREHMLDYIIHLLEDAQDFSWSAAKASHAVLLCRMEQGEISGWADCEKIERIRRAHPHVTAPPPPLKKVKKIKIRINNPAKPFLACISIKIPVQKSSHETRGVLYRHICSACFSAEGKAFPHSQADCRKSKPKKPVIVGRSHVGRAHLARVVYSSNFDHNAIKKASKPGQKCNSSRISQSFGLFQC